MIPAVPAIVLEAAGPIGYQSWRDLLFVHWRAPAHSVQRLLPAGVEVDTWDNAAWLGLVAFRMSGVRLRGLPALPYFSAFPETNVRTYVRYGGDEPGVWFFSLEAPRLAAVLAARWTFRLNYQWARMRAVRSAAKLQYSSRRIVGGALAHSRIEAELPASCPELQGWSQSAPAEPGTLEHFLVERYAFYNLGRGQRIQQGRVRHRPYPLCAAQLVALDESLLAAAGLDPGGAPCHVIFSPGVDVEILPLRLLDLATAKVGWAAT